MLRVSFCKGLVGLLICASTMAASAQNLVPDGDFEGVTPPALPTGFTQFDSSGGGSSASWFTSNPSTVDASATEVRFQAATLASTATAGLVTNSFSVVQDGIYDVAFEGYTSLSGQYALYVYAPGANAIINASSNLVASGTQGLSFATLTNVVQIYTFRFVAAATGVFNFRVTGETYAGVGTTSDFIALDNISVVQKVPEIQASAALLPLCLLSLVMLGSFDRRGSQSRVSVGC